MTETDKVYLRYDPGHPNMPDIVWSSNHQYAGYLIVQSGRAYIQNVVPIYNEVLQVLEKYRND